jgi:hypothetical protein
LRFGTTGKQWAAAAFVDYEILTTKTEALNETLNRLTLRAACGVWWACLDS